MDEGHTYTTLSTLYGMSATFLGTLGTSVGWGMFQIFMITTAILSGVLSGKWKGSSIRARAYLGTGLLFLILATVLFTTGNSRKCRIDCDTQAQIWRKIRTS